MTTKKNNIMTREDIVTAIKEGKTVRSTSSLKRFKFAYQSGRLVMEVSCGRGTAYTHVNDAMCSTAYVD